MTTKQAFIRTDFVIKARLSSMKCCYSPKDTASLNKEKTRNDNAISEGKERTKAENSRSHCQKDDNVNARDPQTVKAQPNSTGETIKIPLTRGQITSDMVMRGNKIDSLTDFKVLITLEMSGKMQTENAAMSRRAYGGDLTMTYPSSAKIVRIFTSSTFTGKILHGNKPKAKSDPCIYKVMNKFIK